MVDQIDKAARRAIEANAKPAWPIRAWRGLVKWWANQPPIIVIVFGIVAVSALTLISGWEMLNSARGWMLLAKDAAPEQLAFLAGCATVLGYLSFHRRASERGREVSRLKDVQPVDLRAVERAESRAWRSWGVATLFAILSLWGIFSNLASKTAMVAHQAEEVNDGRTQLQADIIILENDVDAFNEPLILALIKSKESKVASLTAEARGWGMPNLDVMPPEMTEEEAAKYPGPACLSDLRQRQRDLCNAAHGTIEADGLIGELEAFKADLQKHNENVKALEAKKAELASVAAVEGQEHWDAMSEISAGNMTADQLRIWGMFIASLLFLFGAGLGWDELFEEVERRKGKP